MATSISPPSAGASRSEMSFNNPRQLNTSNSRQSALGFLDLPIELRLEIYGYLLLTVQSISTATKTPYRRLAPILMIEHRSERPGVTNMKPSTVAVPWSSCQPLPFRTHTAILSTCKTVHDEATSLLYEKNVFNFRLPDHAENEAALARSLSEQCNSLFSYKDQSWQAEGPPLLKDSTFACFLNRIGARNAASLKAILFHATQDDVGRYQFAVVGRLLKRHVPDIRFVKFNVATIREWEFPERMPPPMRGRWLHATPYPMTRVNIGKELTRLCGVLTEVIRGCPSIEDFDYSGGAFSSLREQLKGSGKAVRFQGQGSHLYIQEARRMLEERKEKLESSKVKEGREEGERRRTPTRMKTQNEDIEEVYTSKVGSIDLIQGLPETQARATTKIEEGRKGLERQFR